MIQLKQNIYLVIINNVTYFFGRVDMWFIWKLLIEVSTKKKKTVNISKKLYNYFNSTYNLIFKMIMLFCKILGSVWPSFSKTQFSECLLWPKEKSGQTLSSPSFAFVQTLLGGVWPVEVICHLLSFSLSHVSLELFAFFFFGVFSLVSTMTLLCMNLVVDFWCFHTKQ